MKIGADDLINQIADTLCEVDVDFLCEVANKVLAATHTSAGEDDHGYDLIEQNSDEDDLLAQFDAFKATGARRE